MFAYVELVLFLRGSLKTAFHLTLRNLHSEVAFGSFVLK